MLFDTFQYWIFFAFTLALLSALPHRSGKIALVGLSYVFYAFWDVRFLLLLAGSTLANHAFGLLIARREDARRRTMLAIGVTFNLVVLAVFKYLNFFIASFVSLVHLPPSNLLLNVILPVGISFFTFEGVAYLTDVYRRDLPAVRNVVDFALFVSFFPHLIAGPIIRPGNFFPQAEAPAALTKAEVSWGLMQIFKGLVKKIVFADFFGPVADACFGQHPYSGMTVAPLFGLLAFSLQIYFDFAGYTDIARGCAMLLGYRFPPNFERPYLARDVVEFWKRWHISLSTWLRDYLYIPLGGNRLGTSRTYLNLMIVMGLGGLWHGASWNFLIWGLYHGTLLVGHRLWRAALRQLKLEYVLDRPILAPFWITITFVLVTIGWIPFRARDLATSIATFRGLFAPPHLAFLMNVPGFPALTLTSLLVCMVDRNRRLQNKLVKSQSVLLMGAFVGLMLWIIEAFGQLNTAIPFIYFRF
jgi:D-alanyl-lipoteichoic acid acyltransferase DltB (MBOAT superfamily)